MFGDSSFDHLKITSNIKNKVPTGFEHHKEQQKNEMFENYPDVLIIKEELESAKKQLGTLGGGNHFIEIQAGDDGYVWIMIHSGSRNLGYKIAKKYNAIAQKLCQNWYSNIPEFEGEEGLSFLPDKSQEGNGFRVKRIIRQKGFNRIAQRTKGI